MKRQIRFLHVSVHSPHQCSRLTERRFEQSHEACGTHLSLRPPHPTLSLRALPGPDDLFRPAFPHISHDVSLMGRTKPTAAKLYFWMGLCVLTSFCFRSPVVTMLKTKKWAYWVPALERLWSLWLPGYLQAASHICSQGNSCHAVTHKSSHPAGLTVQDMTPLHNIFLSLFPNHEARSCTGVVFSRIPPLLSAQIIPDHF